MEMAMVVSLSVRAKVRMEVGMRITFISDICPHLSSDSPKPTVYRINVGFMLVFFPLIRIVGMGYTDYEVTCHTCIAHINATRAVT